MSYKMKKMKTPMDKKMAQKFGFENSPFKYRQEMNKSSKKGDIHGLFKMKDTKYIEWLKKQLDERESRDKLIYYQNDLRQANARVNYRNQVDRMSGEIQRDNLNHNSVEHLLKQKEQFKSLKFGM